MITKQNYLSDKDLLSHLRRLANLGHTIEAYLKWAKDKQKVVYVFYLGSGITNHKEFKKAYHAFLRSVTRAKKSPFMGSWCGAIEVTKNGAHHIHALATFERNHYGPKLAEIESFMTEKWKQALKRSATEMSCRLDKAWDLTGRIHGNYIKKILDYRDQRNIFCAKAASEDWKAKSYKVAYNLPLEVREACRLENLPSYHYGTGKLVDIMLSEQNLTLYKLLNAFKKAA